MPLRAHFVNVGRGDFTIIEFPSGRIGVVDIDNLGILDDDTRAELLQEYHESVEYQVAVNRGFLPSRLDEAYLTKRRAELTDPLAYYDTHIGRDKAIFRMLITHPDMDHMTGLYRLHRQEGIEIGNFWHTGFDNFNLDDTTDDEWARCPYEKLDWDLYKKLRASTENPKSILKKQGDTGQFWTDDGVELWSPTEDIRKMAVDKNQSNILSMVLKISYRGISIVLGGDATADETWPEIYPHINMKGISVLKASHHGRNSGFYGAAVKEMSPWLTITSVGEKEHDATEKYRRHSQYTVSLRKAGDIRITIADDGKWYYHPNSIAEHWKPKTE